MGAIEDVRKVIQDLVAPELKSLQVQIKSVDETSKLRDEALSAQIANLSEKMDLKFEHVLNEMKANQAMLIYTLNLDNRVKDIERKAAEPMRTT